MITIITATPGSGKTLFAVEMIDKELKKISKELKKSNPDDSILNRQIYHNIDGLDVSKFSEPSRIHDAPKDWRDTPDGSLIIYDEAWEIYPASSKRDITDQSLSDLAIHRHSGHDIVFITQHPTQLHTALRNLCNRHIHLYRRFGLKNSNVYTWQHLVNSPNSRYEQERADKYSWSFPKKYFSYYKSATVHTKTFFIPRKIVITFAFAIALLSFTSYNFYKNKGLKLLSNDRAQDDAISLTDASLGARPELEPEVAISSRHFNWTNDIVDTPVIGCVSNPSASLCMCFSQDGKPLDLSNGQCLSVVNNPLPRYLNTSF